MVTYYNKKDLISFGKYLLSKERAELIKKDHEGMPFGDEDAAERMENVYHADFENWKTANQKKPKFPITDLEIMALGFSPFIDENTGAQQFENTFLRAKVFINHDRSDVTLERYGKSIQIFDLHSLKKSLS